ncbi:MAG TPA: hypothetical protein VM662_07035 [Sphingomonas sp.]|nr:hypothetical protein [Sphingomonas sp.]
MANAFVMRPLPFTPSMSSGTAVGYLASAVANDYAGVVWKSLGGQSQVSVEVDLGSDQSIDTALFFGCTDASTAWTMGVQSATNAAFNTGLVTHAAGIPFLAGSVFPSHGRGVGYWAGDVGLPARRYWRFLIQSLSNAPVTIARLAVGRRMTLERNFAFGGAFGVRDLGSVGWSPTGVLIRRRAAKLRTLGLSFPAVRKDEAEQKVQPLLELVAGQEPIVLVTDPATDSLRQQRCYLGNLTGELGTIWRTAAGWEWRANLIDLIPIPKSA